MADLETAIKGLKCCRNGFCFACPYNDGIDESAEECKQGLADDVLELLKEPEPHVLTVAEINKLPTGESESIPVVMEEKYPFQQWDGGSICKWVGSRFAVAQYRESLEDMPYEWYTYGKTMRFWSGMPTEEQKRGTAWDG